VYAEAGIELVQVVKPLTAWKDAQGHYAITEDAMLPAMMD